MSPLKTGNLVGIYSPYPGAGKSTVADMLVREYGFVRVKMADGLKAMLRSLLAYQGVPMCKIDEIIEGSEKHRHSPFLFDKTPRHAMQTLGTEWGRNCMGQSFWLEVADTKIRPLLWDGKNVVVDDVRFDNEYDYLKKDMNGVMVQIRRPSLEAEKPKRNWFQRLFTKEHSSEGNLSNKPFDLHIFNDYPSADSFARDAAYDIQAYVQAKNQLPDLQG